MRIHRVATCLLAGVALLPACSDVRHRADAATSDPAAHVVRIAVVEPIGPDPAALNPTHAVDVLASDLLFDGLTRYDAAGGQVVPELASAWSTADGVSWTFTLDPHRRFSDGARVTAPDVVASLRRVLSRTTTSIGASRIGIVADLTAPDSSTVDIRLTEPDYELPALLADPTYGVVKASGDGDLGPSADLVTSGSFRVVGTGRRITFEAVRGGDAGIDGVEFVRFDDGRAALAALKAGDVQLAPLGDDAATPAGFDDVTVSAATVVLEVNAGFGAFADGAARRALLQVIDRVTVAQAVTRDESRVTGTIVPGGVVEGPCAACAPVAGTTLAGSAHLDIPPGSLASAVGSELARQLAAAGFTAEVRTTDAPSLQALLAVGTQEMAIFGVTGLAPTPDPYLAAVFGSTGTENLSGTRSADLDAALAAARSTGDPAARRQAYDDLEKRALADGAVIPLVTLGERFAVAKDVVGVRPAAGVLFDARAVRVGAGGS